jgi:hypothetical protein
MECKNIEENDLFQALKAVNERYGDNVEFNRSPEWRGKRICFTLKVKDSKGPGARRGFTGRRLINACWHVHGHFFEKLWSIRPEAEIKAGSLIMRGPEDNWQDRNIGSMMSPLMFSEACNCGE